MKFLSALLLTATMVLMAQGASLLKSDFTNNAQGWTEEFDGQWQVVDGVYEGKTRSSWAGDKNWENYSFSCRARCIEGSDEGQIWLSFRYADEWNRYAIAIRGGLLDDVSLFRYRHSEPPEPRVKCPLNIPLGFDFKGNQWYNVRVEVNGGNIKVWVGDTDKPQIHYTDASPITEGAIALGGNYHLCEFDDIVVDALEPIDMPRKGYFSDSAVKINFAPANVQIAGFKNSDGSQYDPEKGFGWDKNLTGSIRQRNTNVAAELDTIISVAHNETQATFTIDLPNDEYYVTAVAGDPAYPAYFNAYLQDDILLEDCDIKLGASHLAGKYVKVKNNKLRLLLNRPSGKSGLSLAYLAIEKWDDISELKKKKEGELKKSLEAGASEKLAREQKRIKQREDYKPVKIEKIDSNDRTIVSLDGEWLFMPDQEVEANSKPYAPLEPDTLWHVLEVPNFWNQIGWWTMLMSSVGERGNSMSYRHDEIRRTAEYTFDYGNTQSAWYRQWVEIPQSAQGQRISIKFDAVASGSEVYINGEKAGEHFGMFTPFEVELTDHVKYGQQNLIAVHVSGSIYKQTADSNKAAGVAVSMVITDEMLNSMPKGMYASQATSDDLHTNKRLPRPNGIWQPVQLIVAPKAKLDDVFFKPRLDGGEIEVTVENSHTETFAGKLEISVAGETIDEQVRIPAEGSELFRLNIDVNNPKQWSPETPNLYKLTVRLIEDGQPIDTFNCNVGFRTFEVVGKDIYFNGKPRWMGGANHPPHGLRPNDKKLANKFFKFMHDGNQMMTRAHASPVTPVWADAADKQGVAISVEGTWPWVGLHGQPMPTGFLLETWYNEILDLVKQLRNHPSVVMWTVGNEFNYHPKYHKNEENPEEAYLAKMKVLSDLVERIRRLDPTRPVCLWSGYEREKEIYERILEPNGVDDGDFTDLHRSHGYAYATTFRDCYYNGGYLPEHTGQPIISQEPTTCYPNDDNGSVERHYIQLYVPQSWIGDNAYEHRDPNYFLNYNAFITKEWVEDVRRTRRTAAWLAFSNNCWFQYASFVEHIRPYKTYYNMKLALQPILPSLDQRDRHYYAGNMFKGLVVVVNDDVNYLDYEGVKCLVTLKNSRGEVLAGKEIHIGECAYYSKAQAEFEFRIPVNAVEGRGSCVLELVLKSKSKTLGENRYNLLVANKNWAFDVGKDDEVAVVKAEGKTAAILKDLGLKNIPVGQIKKKKAIIWANRPLPKKTEDLAVKLLEYVKNGGTLIALETLNAQEFVPDNIIKDKYAFMWSVEFANIETPWHSIFDGFSSQDLGWWNGNGSSPMAAEISYLLNDSEKVLILAEHIPTHVYGWNGPIATPMFIVNYGKGKILISELKTSVADTDPLAGRMLSNIVKWAMQ